MLILLKADVVFRMPKIEIALRQECMRANPYCYCNLDLAS